MATEDTRPVQDQRLPEGETPDEGEAYVSESTGTKYTEHGWALTDRINPGEYPVISSPYEDTEEEPPAPTP